MLSDEMVKDALQVTKLERSRIRAVAHRPILTILLITLITV